MTTKNIQPIEDFNWDALGKKENSFDGVSREELEKKYGETFSQIQEGTVVEGTVVAITKREVVVNISELWDEIEKNSFGLLENPFSSKSENKDGLVNYLKSLYDMKTAASGSAESIGGLRTTMQNIVGIERSMNQAVRFANEDLTTYVNFTERLCASIDKILAKARFVVGDIDYEIIEPVHETK